MFLFFNTDLFSPPVIIILNQQHNTVELLALFGILLILVN